MCVSSGKTLSGDRFPWEGWSGHGWIQLAAAGRGRWCDLLRHTSLCRWKLCWSNLLWTLVGAVLRPKHDHTTPSAALVWARWTQCCFCSQPSHTMWGGLKIKVRWGLRAAGCCPWCWNTPSRAGMGGGGDPRLHRVLSPSSGEAES